MNVIIIEDEPKSAKDLHNQLMYIDPRMRVVTILDSVASSIKYIKENLMPDLIFMDIHLGDGISFNIFSNVDITCPVVFCTAYDEYSIEAFRFNGIGYIVKPINNQQLKETLVRHKVLKNHFHQKSSITRIAQLLEHQFQPHKTTFLIYFKNKMVPISTTEIAFFYVKESITYLVTTQAEYPLSKTLETIEKELDPKQFYRANRQYIVSYNFIKELEIFETRKIIVNMKLAVMTPIIIGKEKVVEFKNWMENR